MKFITGYATTIDSDCEPFFGNSCKKKKEKEKKVRGFWQCLLLVCCYLGIFIFKFSIRTSCQHNLCRTLCAHPSRCETTEDVGGDCRRLNFSYIMCVISNCLSFYTGQFNIILLQAQVLNLSLSVHLFIRNVYVQEFDKKKESGLSMRQRLEDKIEINERVS